MGGRELCSIFSVTVWIRYLVPFTFGSRFQLLVALRSWSVIFSPLHCCWFCHKFEICYCGFRYVQGVWSTFCGVCILEDTGQFPDNKMFDWGSLSKLS